MREFNAMNYLWRHPHYLRLKYKYHLTENALIFELNQAINQHSHRLPQINSSRELNDLVNLLESLG